MSRVPWLGAVACAALALLGCGRRAGSDAAAEEALKVYVPCGMLLPFMEAERAFEAAHPGAQVESVFDNANVLVRRIVQRGEQPDLIVSPGEVEMEALLAAGKVSRADVTTFGRYELMLFTPRANPGRVSDFGDLLKREVRLIALPDPEHNSVGRYARQALENLGLWEQVRPKIEFTDHPITAYEWVARGKADASFAYRSCPLESAPEKLEYAKVHIARSVPFDLYAPARGAIAVLKDSPRRALAERFVAFLLSPEGRRVLRGNGVPDDAPPGAQEAHAEARP